MTMQAAATMRPTPIARIIVCVVIGVALAVGGFALHRADTTPSTDDASIDADVVHIAALVGGRIIELPIEENAAVAAGDLLFRIDPKPYELAVAQAQADLELAQALLATQLRVLSTQRSAVEVATDQTRRAETNLALASRTTTRLRPLQAQGYVTTQQLDQAEVAERDATTSLSQAREQQAAAVRAVDTDEAARATVRAREAALAIAKRALDDTSVRAPHAGRIVGLTALSGEVVAPSQALFTLVSTERWFAIGNFRETDLRAIKAGDCATVYSMMDRSRPMRGVVQGIGWGVLDTERVNLPRSVPYVERSLNWVRVAQRFPVRVELRNPPVELVRLGASAVVEVKRGDGCR